MEKKYTTSEQSYRNKLQSYVRSYLSAIQRSVCARSPAELLSAIIDAENEWYNAECAAITLKTYYPNAEV